MESSHNWLPKTVAALKAGELVALPTETVYGLAGNALSEESVRKIFDVKGRPLIDPLIVHIYDLKQVDQLAVISPQLELLAKHFWPGPLTIILKKKAIVPGLVTAGLDTVAIRMPKHPIMREVLKESKLPLAAPSANPFGYLSPTTAEHVESQLGEKISYVVDGGPCEIGIESTILDLTHKNGPRIVRPGPITEQMIYEATDITVATKERQAIAKDNSPQLAPGMLSQHYSPKTPLYLFEHGTAPEALPKDKKIAVIFNKRPSGSSSENAYWLSENGNSADVAHNLFETLHRMDHLSLDAIYLERASDSGIGKAINDRLERAQHKRRSA